MLLDIDGGIRGARFVPIESDNHLLAQERGWRHWLAEVEDFSRRQATRTTRRRHSWT